jgi:hypothetical protein
MNHLIYMYIVISGVLASPYAPIQTPITTVAAVHVRQDITSAATTTPPELIVYYSAADSDEMTICKFYQKGFIPDAMSKNTF